MITWLIVAGYVVFGIGTMRIVLARMITSDVDEYLDTGRGPSGQIRTTEERVNDAVAWSWSTYGPLNLVMSGLAGLGWPVVGTWLLASATVGPLVARWWRMPLERQLAKRRTT